MKPIFDSINGNLNNALSLLKDQKNYNHWYALQRMLEFDEEDLQNLHSTLFSSSVSLSRALQHKFSEGLDALNAERTVAIKQCHSPFLSWSLDWKLGRIGIDFFTGNRGSAATRFLRLAAAIADSESEAGIDVGVIIFLTGKAKLRGNLDTSVPTWEEATQQIKLFSAFIHSPILIMGLDGPEDFLVERTSSVGQKSKCVPLDRELD